MTTRSNGPISEYSEAPRSDDTLTNQVQRGLADASTVPHNPQPLSNTIDAEGLSRGMEMARQYLRQNNVDEREFEPSALQTFGAYFREGNTVASALSSHTLAETLFPTPNSPSLSTDEILKRIEADKLGPYQEHFVGVNTVADYEAVKADINRKLEDQRTMAASGVFSGTAAMLAAGVIDLPSLLPGGLAVRGLKGAGAAGLATSFAGGAVLQAGASEAALQATQVGRTWEESAAGVGGSAILGGILGSAAHAVAYRTLGPNVVRKVETNLKSAVTDLSDGQAGMRSAGAAQLNAYERMRAEGLDSQKSVSSFGALESLKALGRVGGDSPNWNWIGKNARIPMLDLERTQSPAALNALNGLVYRVGITRANAAGEAVEGSPVIAYVRDYQESLAKIAEKTTLEHKAAESAFRDYDDFDTQVTRALINPSAPAHPAVEKIAREHRKVYTRIVDELIEAKVLPPTVKERYGDAYFPMVFDADSIRADEHTFKRMISEGFSKQMREEAEDALRKKLGRQAQNEGVERRIVGVTEKRGKVDDQGAPVTNPRTGKQVQEAVVVEEGLQLQRQRIAREQYQLRKEYLEENRRLSSDVFDRETKEITTAINRTYDESGQNLAREATDLLDRTARSEQLTPAQRAKRAREINAEQKRQLDALEKERQQQLDRVQKTRRDQKKAILDPINRELDEAKTIRDEAIAHARGVAKEQLAASKVSVREGLEGGLRFTRDGKVADDLVKQEADALAQRWYDSTTQWNKYTLEHEIEGFTEFLKKRRTPVDHMDLLNAGFVKGNAYSILEDYIRMAGTDAAVARTFKRKVKEAGPDGKVTKESELIDVGDLKLGAVKEDIIADYDALRDNLLSSPEFKAKEGALEKKYEKLVAGADDAKKAELASEFQKELNGLRGEAEKKLVAQRDMDLANIEAVLDAIRGTSKAGASQSFRNAVELVSGLNYMRLLGGTVVSSLTDPVKIAIANGLGNTVKGAMLAYQQTFASSWKTANAAQKGLGRAGAAMAELHLQARLAQMADVGNPHRVDSTSVSFMRRATQMFSKVSGITYWNGFWKQVSENATTAYLGQLAHKGWGNLSKSERAWLASLRINGEGLDLIRAAHQKQAGDKFFDDWPMLMHEGWDDRQAAQLVRHAIGEELNNQVVTPQSYDRMTFATTPQGRVLWQFRQHMISNQMRFVGRQAQLASLDKDRTAGLAVGFVGLVIAGAMVDFLKQASGQIGVTGNLDRNRSSLQRQMDEWSKTPGMALYNALDRSDALPGIFAEASNILDKTIGFGPKSALTLFDDKAALKEASRYKNRSVADTIGGPTLGLVNDGIGAANTLKKIVTGQRIGRSDYRSAERLIPGQNIPYVQLIGNTFEREVGDMYSWPNPQ